MLPVAYHNPSGVIIIKNAGFSLRGRQEVRHSVTREGKGINTGAEIQRRTDFWHQLLPGGLLGIYFLPFFSGVGQESVYRT